MNAAAVADRVRRFLRAQSGVTAASAEPAGDGREVRAAVTVAATPCGLPERAVAGGTVLSELNTYETDYLYGEIVTGRVYAPDGMRLPPRPVLLDVGANIGMYALWAATEYPGATVYAFEPAPDAYAALYANVTRHTLPVTCLPWAFGGRDGPGSMTVYPAASVFSGMYADQRVDRAAIGAAIGAGVDQRVATAVVDRLAEARMAGAYRVPVQVVTMRRVLSLLGEPRIDLLKLDAEGAEADLLGAFTAADWARIDRIVLEVHRTEAVGPIEALLTGAGYDCSRSTVDALRGTGYVNLYAHRHVPAQPRPAPRPLSSSAPLRAPQRLRRALDAFLSDDDIPVRLDVTAARDA